MRNLKPRSREKTIRTIVAFVIGKKYFIQEEARGSLVYLYEIAIVLSFRDCVVFSLLQRWMSRLKGVIPGPAIEALMGLIANYLGYTDTELDERDLLSTVMQSKSMFTREVWEIIYTKMEEQLTIVELEMLWEYVQECAESSSSDDDQMMPCEQTPQGLHDDIASVEEDEPQSNFDDGGRIPQREYDDDDDEEMLSEGETPASSGRSGDDEGDSIYQEARGSR